MIFRRFSQHVREQNWFAVGLDLLVVIIGIFLGFQLTEWNQARKDRAVEERYLNQFLADVDSSLALQARDEVTIQERVEGLDLVLRMLNERTLTDDRREEFENGFRYVMGQWGGSGLGFISSTLEELESSGRLTMIRSAALRREMVGFRNEVAWYRAATENVSRGIIPARFEIAGLVRFGLEGELLSSNKELLGNDLIYRQILYLRNWHRISNFLVERIRDRTARLRIAVQTAVDDNDE